MERDYIIEKDGRIRKGCLTVHCLVCGEKFLSRSDQVRKYCSKACAREARKKETTVECAFCGKAFQRRASSLNSSRTKTFFCSRSHKDQGQRVDNGITQIHPPHYGNGAHSYRERALSSYGKVCGGCRYCEFEEMLDVHHLDGDRKNGKISNLMVLCLWCHGLVTRGLARVELPSRKITKV